jgi:proline iminopeptidase
MAQRETLMRTTGVAVPGLLGVGLGLAMPRGPISTAQSLTGLALAAAAGVGCGWLLRSRWAALLAPVLFAAVFEVVRLPASGPTVDAVRFDGGLWGLVALITGRGFDVVVLLVPMVVGAFWGAALARRSRPATAGGRRRAGQVLLVAASAVVVVLAVALARPAGTEPIRSPDGEVLEGSIAEVAKVTVRGHELGMLLRGRDADLPVLLFLEGGPGGTAIGAMRHAGERLEEHFVVATWDQRGTGTSIGAREPVVSMTVADAVADTVAVAEHLRQRFEEDRIYLVGSSWGSTLGVLTVQARPDLFHAFVGTGQMVNQQETDRRMYAESVAYAERVGDEAFARRLAAIGPPPYEDMLAYPTAITSNPDWDAYGRGPDHDSRSAYPMSLFVAEYTLTQQVRGMGALIDTFAVLYPQLQDVDFRRSPTSLDVPVYLVEGAHEAPGRLVLAQEWFAMLDAPSKRMVVLEHSGHTPHLDEPGAFRDVMVDVVLAETGTG